MRILFLMRHAGYVRNFEWVLRLLVQRSHRVHLGFERSRTQFPPPDRLCSETDGAVTHGHVPVRGDAWRPLAFGLRQSVSYLRYLSPAYRDAERLRARWARGTPWIVRLAAGAPGLRSPAGLAALERGLRAGERLVPRAKEIDSYLSRGGYDAVLVTPLVDGPTQHDWVRSARALGIPIVLAVASWDNLTNKGLLFDRPDRVYVWNEIQRREAVELHGLAPDAVVPVGAHPFDHWFEWGPATTREEFCAEVGLDPARPFLLYVCSSGFIAPEERPIVRRWIEVLRDDPALADVGVLVRPHPTNGSIWSEHPLAGLPNVAVWPGVGADPSDERRRSNFYDSMFHSAAVVGANTTALIDAAVVGRRTFSVLLPELRGAQEDTLHFHYLLPEHGGALTVAGSLEEHRRQLRDHLARPGADGWRERFLAAFVRPQGLDAPCAPRLVDDLEQLLQPGRRGVRRPAAPVGSGAAAAD
jgi:hypothetical protein